MVFIVGMFTAWTSLQVGSEGFAEWRAANWKH